MDNQYIQLSAEYGIDLSDYDCDYDYTLSSFDDNEDLDNGWGNMIEDEDVPPKFRVNLDWYVECHGNFAPE